MGTKKATRHTKRTATKPRAVRYASRFPHPPSTPDDPFDDERAWENAWRTVISKAARIAAAQGHLEPWHGVRSARVLADVAVAVANFGALPPRASPEFEAGLAVAERRFLVRPQSGSRDERRFALGEAVKRYLPAKPKRRPGRPKLDASVLFAARHALLLQDIGRRAALARRTVRATRDGGRPLDRVRLQGRGREHPRDTGVE